jgi:hypothetical protein
MSSVTMLRRASLVLHCITLAMLHTVATAHSLQEIDRLFEDEAIPAELVELTKELDMTAGAKTIREQAHSKQHAVLEEYLRARTARKCTEARTTISRLDLEIVALQERGEYEEEHARRKIRDDTTAFIKESCRTTAISE